MGGPPRGPGGDITYPGGPPWGVLACQVGSQMLSLLVLLCDTRTGVKDLSLQSQSFLSTDCPNFEEKKDTFLHNIPPGQCDPYMLELVWIFSKYRYFLVNIDSY